ncbi:MAG: hypothetical protein ACYCQI_03605 [Gammaproteobacteria bacterium]
MNWNKKGLIYQAEKYSVDWAIESALTPTPILLNPDVIRVYFGARDKLGVSRIRFVDLNANNPSEILYVSDTPSLDIGEPGTFDDNGVIMGDILEVNGQLHMFYVGFQLVEKVKFLAFTGLAISHDNGRTFKRVSRTPILDRSDEGLYIRAVHSAFFENGIWRIWYAAGDKWNFINDVPYPNYYIKYTESRDLMQFPKEGMTCLQCQGNEYRIGRPRVYKNSEDYLIYYTKGDTNGSYLPGFATSKNGLDWHRQDHLVGISTSDSGWDSKTLCYPSLLVNGSGKTYMFYNGNFMGKDGFGYAELSHN